jgi:transcriptional regulator with XRE-family HTH domain
MQNKIHKGLAHRVNTARKKKGLTQQALAKKLNTDQTTISQIERGLITRPRNTKKMAKELGVTEAWLFGYEKQSSELDDGIKKVDLDALSTYVEAAIKKDLELNTNLPIRKLIDIAITAYELDSATDSDDIMTLIMKKHA